MHTAAHCPCQTGARRRQTAWGAALTWGGVCLFLGLAVGKSVCAEPTPAPPAPPQWQQELAAARLADVTVAAASTGTGSAAADVRLRLDELFRSLAARYPREAAVRKAAGDHFWMSGNAGLAVAEWHAAQALNPADDEVASSLGSAALAAGSTQVARAEFQRAVDARPGAAHHHFDLANVLYLFGHEFVDSPAFANEAAVSREALRQYRLAAELDSQNLEYARGYAETFFGVRDPDWKMGLAAWERVRTLTAANPDIANANLARISLRQHKPDDAEAYLALIRDPQFDPSKAKLHQQAERMKSSPATPPP